MKALAKPSDVRGADVESAPTAAAMSFFGDLHPSFFGNVVKAMASAKQGYPIVSRVLARGRAGVAERATPQFFAQLERRAARDACTTSSG